jgi:hypothetical protein
LDPIWTHLDGINYNPGDLGAESILQIFYQDPKEVFARLSKGGLGLYQEPVAEARKVGVTTHYCSDVWVPCTGSNLRTRDIA